MAETGIAVFGGGCFWCTEAVFKMMKGVNEVVPGYVDGVEVVRMIYDPTQVDYRDLLTVFFGGHDPTTPDRQGNDVGPQYRSVIFYTTAEQQTLAEKMIKEVNASNKLGAPIVTTIEPLTNFAEAEGYHHDYFKNHKNNPYCQLVINPKLEKVQKRFANLLKNL